jgi:hypothetical protein
MRQTYRFLASVTVVAAALALAALAPEAHARYADTVVGYAWGGGEPGYNNPAAALGSPERMTGEGVWPGQVDPFNPPWLASEIVSIGPAGGYLTLGFSRPVRSDRGDGYAADLIVFGNTFFYGDFSVWPPANEDPARAAAEPGRIQVSPDGLEWFDIPGNAADGLWPTLGYVDSDAGASPGAVPTNFWQPMNPALALADFDGISYAAMLALYGTSGGGAAVDIADAVDAGGLPANLASISFIRFSVPEGADYTIEIDAVSVVPEPATLALVVGGLVTAAVTARTRKRAA